MRNLILISALVICSITASFSQSIQPKLDWAITTGNSGQEIRLEDSKVDMDGNIYSVGYFYGNIDFDPGPNSFFYTSPISVKTSYVQKLDSTGSFVWAKIFSSPSQSSSLCSTIDFDQNGNVYVAGSFKGSIDLDPNLGVFNLTSTISGPSTFLVKMDANGNFIWGQQYATGSLYSGVMKLQLDNLDDIILSGIFAGTVDFDYDSTTLNLLSSQNNHDQFTLKLDEDGDFIWVKQFTGSGSISIYDLAIDHNNDIIMVGKLTQPSDFDPGPNSFVLSPADDGLYYTVKLDANGNLEWAFAMGLVFGESLVITNVAINNSNNVYVSGGYTGTIDFDPDTTSTFMMTSSGMYSQFVLKLNSSGDFLWAKGDQKGSAGPVSAIDNDGNLYSTSAVNGSVDFDPGSDSLILTDGKYYIQKLDSNGNFVWAKRGGSHGYIYPEKVNLLNSTSFLVTGGFSSGWDIDFNPDSTKTLLSAQGLSDVFYLKFDQALSLGTEDVMGKVEFDVFPNPTSGSLVIEVDVFEDVEVMLFDLSGNLIFKTSVNQNSTRLDISHIPSGAYFIAVQSGRNRGIQKLVKL
ncbi:T9SS type A sorting domain-containing protein [bacterium SCSIO 12643]|nr:T9SS type A sorting domain-containing protein [bacterium SCSIO 12643]